MSSAIWLSTPAWSDRPAIDRRAVFGASLLTLAATIVSLVPVNPLRRIGGDAATLSWLVVIPVRMMLCVIGIYALVRVNGLPPGPTALTTIVLYLAMLIAETILAYRFASTTSASPPGNET